MEPAPTCARDQVVNAKLDSDVVHIWNVAGRWAFMASASLWSFAVSVFSDLPVPPAATALTSMAMQVVDWCSLARW